MGKCIQVFIILILFSSIVVLSRDNSYADDIYQCKGFDGVIPTFTNMPMHGKHCEIIVKDKSEVDSQLTRHQALKNRSRRHSLDKTIRIDDKINEINNSVAGLNNFYKAVYRLKKDSRNKVVIYQFGDSHVSSLIFPRQIELNLNKEFNNQKKSDTRGSRLTIINYYTYGMSGKTIDYFSSSKYLKDNLSTLKPHLVIITLGTNDAFAEISYETAVSRLNKLADIMKSSSPNSSILFTIPSDCFYKGNNTNPHIGVIRHAIIDFCNLKKYAYWDLYKIMGGKSSMEVWFNKGLSSSDGVHFTESGYLYHGDMICNALKKGYQQFLH